MTSNVPTVYGRIRNGTFPHPKNEVTFNLLVNKKRLPNNIVVLYIN